MARRSAGIQVRAITAVLVESPRAERLATFYREVLGVPLRHLDLPGFPPHWGAEVGSVYFAVLAGRRRASRTCVAFYVDDARAAARRLRSLRVKQLSAPTRTPLGLIGRFADSDGNPFELYQP